MNVEYRAINVYNIMIFSNFYLFNYFFLFILSPFLSFKGYIILAYVMLKEGEV